MADSTSLTGGWIAVIVVPSVCVVIIVLLVYIWWARRHRKDIDERELERQVSKRVVAYERTRAAAYGRQYPHHHHRHHHHRHHHQNLHRSQSGSTNHEDLRSQRQYWYTRNLVTEPPLAQDISRYRWSKHSEALGQPATIQEEGPEHEVPNSSEILDAEKGVMAEQQAPLLDDSTAHYPYPQRNRSHHAPSHSADAVMPATPLNRIARSEESRMNLPTPSNAALWPVQSEPNTSSASPLQVYPSKQPRNASMRKRLILRANSLTKWGRFSSHKQSEKPHGLFTSTPQSYHPDIAAHELDSQIPATRENAKYSQPLPSKYRRVSRISSVSSSMSRRSSKSQLSSRSLASIMRLQQHSQAQRHAKEKPKDAEHTSMQIWDIGGIPKRQSSLSFSSSVATTANRSVLDKPLPEFPKGRLDSFPKLPPLQYFDSPLMPSVENLSTPPQAPAIPIEYDGRGMPILKPSPPLHIAKKSSSSAGLVPRDDLHDPLSRDDIEPREQTRDVNNNMTPKSVQTMYTARTSISASETPPLQLGPAPPTRALHHRFNASSSSLLRSGTPPPPLRRSTNDTTAVPTTTTTTTPPPPQPRLEFSEIVAPHTPPPQRLFKFPPSSPPPTPPLQQDPPAKASYSSFFPKLTLKPGRSPSLKKTTQYYGPPPPKLPVDLANLPPELSPQSVALVQSLTAEKQQGGADTPTEDTNGTTVLILARAVHSYSPELDDELELIKGDWLVVYVLFDDGWCYSKLVQAGGGVNMSDRDLLEGICPKACLAIMDRSQNVGVDGTAVH